METLLAISSNPLMLVAMLCCVSWLWEDAAVISGALLAVEGYLSIPLALVAVFVGIMSGDLALYYLGLLAHRWRALRAWILTNPKSRSMSRRFRQHTVSNIFIIRFIPGLRTVGFTLCGVWRVSFHRFIVAMTLAGISWIAIVFTLVYHLGASEWLSGSYWKWSIMGVALVLLVFNNVWAHRLSRRGSLKSKEDPDDK